MTVLGPPRTWRRLSGRPTSRPPSGRRSRRLAAGGGAAALALAAVLFWPVTTRQGVNFAVSTHTIPLYRKALDFVERSAEYERLSREAVAGATTDEAKALAAFAWTRAHVRPTLDGMPIVDDHILNIVTRGHGMPDQQADVFATVATYAGVPAFWRSLKAPGMRRNLLLTFVQIGGAFRVFDVANGVVFRRANGELATLADVQTGRAAIPEPVASIDVGGMPYAAVIAAVTPPEIPDPSRAELQMPGRRLWHEVKVAVGVESRYEP